MSRKILFHVQSLLVSGHTHRIATLAKGFQSAGFEVLLATGEPEGRFKNQLPHLALDIIRTSDSVFSHLVDHNGIEIDDELWSRRSNTLQTAMREWCPNLLIIEGFPFARTKFRSELTSLMEIAQARNIPIISSIRDIVQPLLKERKIKACLEQLDYYFDMILIHGDPNLVRLEESFEATEHIKTPMFYTGYIDSDPTLMTHENKTDEIIVSAGGGATGDFLYKTALKTAQFDLQNRPLPWKWRFLIGARYDTENYKALKIKAPENAYLERARGDFRQILRQSKASVSQFGYNTALDILTAQCPTVIVPFAQGTEAEQTMRAEKYAKEGVCKVISENIITPQKLITTLEEVISEARITPSIDCNGIPESIRIVTHLLDKTPS